MKTLMVCLVLTVALAMVSSTAIAQGLWDFPAWTQQPLTVPSVGANGEILIDNFEYWDSPYNHGWVQNEPAYPVYGFGMGYATIFNTVLDLQEGSRVLDVYRPSSVFLLGTQYEQHVICHQLPVICGGGLPVCLSPGEKNYDSKVTQTPILSFKFRAPLGIELFDIFRVQVIGVDTDTGDTVTLTVIPTQAPNMTCQGANCCGNLPYTKNGNDYTVQIGRQFLDGSWHTIWLDLCCLTEGKMDIAAMICASGQMFRLDDIIFRPADMDDAMCEPYLFKIGPRYAQIFEPYRYLFVAEYCAADGAVNVMDLLLIDANDRLPEDEGYNPAALNNIFETDPNEIEAYWLAQGADPNSFDPNHPSYLTPDSGISAAMGRDFVIYPWVPIFSRDDFRFNASGVGDPNKFQNPAFVDMTGSSGINQTLQWNATVNGLGANGIQFQGLSPLAISPLDGMPTYIPNYCRCGCVASIYGTQHWGPALVTALEGALYNAGFTFWPNIASIDFTPQVFEDIILTIEVTNGRTSDYETFPISVVNYPVENYPPYIEDVDDQLFMVGEVGEYPLSVIDADNFIFSTAPFVTGNPAATSHNPAIGVGDIRTDMDNITWDMTLNGLTSYQYGPWMQSMIDPKNGVISFTPQFEGAYDAIVVATDNRGASSIAEFTIFSVVQGTWLNHPPIVLGDWDHPQTVVAGEEFILTTPEFCVVDPDGDEIYYSCNIGSCGQRTNGDFMWTFTTNFPGFYTAEIIAYDIRGGYAIITVDVEVKPWWSF
jgi:hypothetical protein